MCNCEAFSQGLVRKSDEPTVTSCSMNENVPLDASEIAYRAEESWFEPNP